jgi:hypothetical protein
MPSSGYGLASREFAEALCDARDATEREALSSLGDSPALYVVLHRSGDDRHVKWR